MSVWESISPEEELLIRCASPQVSDASRDRIESLLDGSLDTGFLVSQARLHGTVGLLYAHVEEANPAHALMETLPELVQGLALHNLQHTRELVRIANLLMQEEIRVLPFKGPMLSHVVYRNAAYRSFQDIDVLLPREELLRAKETLERHGYVPLYDLTEREEQERIEAQVGYELKHERHGMTHIVELHWSFLNTVHSFDLDPQAVFDRAETVRLGGCEMLNMAPEDLLLYLCAHGAKHHWERLKWIADVNALIRARPDLDWREALDRAEALHSVRMVGLGLYMAAEFLEAPLPEWVERTVLVDSIIPHLARKVLQCWLFREPDAPEIDGVDAFWFLVRSRERWRDSFPYVKHHAKLLVSPSQKDRAVVALPDSLSGLYYLIRPFRVLKQRLF